MKFSFNDSEEVNELERLKEERLEAMFPDEVDTPRDAKVGLSKDFSRCCHVVEHTGMRDL